MSTDLRFLLAKMIRVKLIIRKNTCLCCFRLQPISASFLPSWNVTVNVTRTTNHILGVSWSDVANRLGGGVRQYIVLYRKPNSSLTDGQIVSSNTTFLQITGLEVYTEYSIRAVAISGEGVPFRSADVLAMTDEGGK